MNQVLRVTCLFLTLGRLRQEDHKFQADLRHYHNIKAIVSLYINHSDE